MSKFSTISVSTEDLQAELQTLQSDYRTTNSMLARAKRTGSKADIRELTRAKNRISDRLDAAKNRLNSQTSY
jgi:hypothetical protein